MQKGDAGKVNQVGEKPQHAGTMMTSTGNV